MRRRAVLMVVVALLAVGCDRSAGEPPPPPTVPETLPPATDTEGCGDLVDAALGLLQGQLDALADATLDQASDPSFPLPGLAELGPVTAELEQRAAELCGEGELAGLLAARLGELAPRNRLGERYLELVGEELDQ